MFELLRAATIDHDPTLESNILLQRTVFGPARLLVDRLAPPPPEGLSFSLVALIRNKYGQIASDAEKTAGLPTILDKNSESSPLIVARPGFVAIQGIVNCCKLMKPERYKAGIWGVKEDIEASVLTNWYAVNLRTIAPPGNAQIPPSPGQIIRPIHARKLSSSRDIGQAIDML